MKRCILRVINFQYQQKRFCSRPVRVRFAPSPTGDIHLGGLRTALYNYLYARANNGTFILRIEDTDQSRVVPGAIDQIQFDLTWVGIISDENPTRGGPYGPYLQSKRLDIYKEQVVKLLENKTAYYCFCTEHRLQLLRREMLKSQQVPKYDNRCRNLSTAEVNEKLRNGQPHCIRFKLPMASEPFNDLVYGRVFHDIAQHEGDFVIMKGDGYPTYHFANVVDDYFMEISHVLRGIEWQVSTPKHISLYKAFGWTPPLYGHLPLILNPNGTKLSKRQGDIKINHLRAQNIFPLALVNYVITAGGGFDSSYDINSVDRIFSYEELIKQFDISKINTNSGKLMPEKLLEYNKLELQKLLSNEIDSKILALKVKNIVLQHFPEMKDSKALKLDEDHVLNILKWAQNRITTLSDLIMPHLRFLWIIPTTLPDFSSTDLLENIKTLSKILAETDDNNFHKSWINKYLKQFAEDNNISYGLMMKSLRIILSGGEEGPPVSEIMEILGKDETVTRLQRVVQ